MESSLSVGARGALARRSRARGRSAKPADSVLSPIQEQNESENVGARPEDAEGTREAGALGRVKPAARAARGSRAKAQPKAAPEDAVENGEAAGPDAKKAGTETQAVGVKRCVAVCHKVCELTPWCFWIAHLTVVGWAMMFLLEKCVIS
jgi:hypothetical protein